MSLLVVTCKDVEKELDSQSLRGEQKGRKLRTFSCLEVSYAGNHKIPMFTEDLHSADAQQKT